MWKAGASQVPLIGLNKVRFRYAVFHETRNCSAKINIRTVYETSGVRCGSDSRSLCFHCRHPSPGINAQL